MNLSTYAAQKWLALAALAALLLVVLAPLLYYRLAAGTKVATADKAINALPATATAEQRKQLAEQRARWEKRRKIRILGAVMGKDGRLSTSQAIAGVWTLVVVYVLLALLIVWPDDWDAALKNLQGPYLALLGGPVAAVVLSGTIVSGRIKRETLQKGKGDGIPRLSDLVSDDSGSTDLFDLQYVLFNVIAMAYVLTAFSKATLAGFPDVPTTLWLLTGGPAAVYVSNKAFGTNAPAIFSVDPARARKGEKITVYGQNFVVAGTGDRTDPAAPTLSVQIDGAKADVDAASVTGTSVRATVPADLTTSGPAIVTVVTDAGVPANRAGLLTVVADPPRRTRAPHMVRSRVGARAAGGPDGQS
jgi:IPT/TIG domain